MAKKKSKAQIAYERERRKLLQRRRRDIKAGAEYYELPKTPRQAGKKKMLAKDWQKALTQIKRVGKEIKKEIDVWKKEQKARRKVSVAEEDAARQALENFCAGLEGGAGGQIILGQLYAWAGQYGYTKVVTALQDAQNDGIEIGNAEYYNEKMAKEYISKLKPYMEGRNVGTADDWITSDTAINNLPEWAEGDMW